MEEVPGQSEPRRRRRPALACRKCRRRKVKCDRSHPCRNCISGGYECAYEIGLSTSQTNPRTTDDNCFVPRNSPNRSPLREAATVNDVSPSRAIPSKEEEIQSLRKRVEELEKPRPNLNISDGLSPTDRDAPRFQIELSRLQVTINKSRISRADHWKAITQQIAKSVAFFQEVTGHGDGVSFQSAAVRPLVTQTLDLLQECKAMAKNMKHVRPTRGLSPQRISLDPPPRAEADAMVELYFKYFESTYRILHIPTFKREYDRFWENPGEAPMSLRFVILLVVAIGSSVTNQKTKEAEFRNTVHQWVYAAQTWLSGPLEKDRLTLVGIQVHCLTILARQVFSLGGDLTWTSMGSLIHRAMHMGLHRDPKHLPAMPLLQAEVRRRLWATILELILQSSLDSEMPPRISLDEFDTEPPSNTNDEDMDEATTMLRIYAEHEYTTTSIQLLLLRSFQARLQVVQLLNGLSSSISYIDTLSLSSEIAVACGSCRVLGSIKEEKPGVTPFHRNLYDFFVRRFLLHLHSPFVCRCSTDPLFYYSRKVSLDAAMAMMCPELDEPFHRLMVIGGGMFRNGIRFAGFAISLELIMHTQAQCLDNTVFRSIEQRESLKRVIEKMIFLSAERIEYGETNVKNHMFLSMVLAEAEAMETSAPAEDSELRIAESARNSLELCHNLLQAQVDHTHSGGFSEMSTADFGGDLEIYPWDFDMDFSFQDAAFS